MSSIQFDTSITDSSLGLGEGELSFGPMTIGTGSNRILVVFFSIDNTTSDIASATFNDVAMIAHTQFETSGRTYLLFYLLNPDSGSHDIEVTFGLSVTRFLIAASWSGVKQIAPADLTNATGTGTALSWAVDSASGDQVAVLALGEDNTITMAWESPAVERLDHQFSVLAGSGYIAEEESAGSTVTINGTASGSTTWAGTAFNLQPVAGQFFAPLMAPRIAP